MIITWADTTKPKRSRCEEAKADVAISFKFTRFGLFISKLRSHRLYDVFYVLSKFSLIIYKVYLKLILIFF